jgi:O-antigen/teichoic acid export membrane protein
MRSNPTSRCKSRPPAPAPAAMTDSGSRVMAVGSRRRAEKEPRAGSRCARVVALAARLSLLAAARIAGALAGFVTQVVLARALQASALGLFYSVTSMAALVSLIAAHGYPAIAARFLSRYRERSRQEWVAAFVAKARREATFYVAIALVAVSAFAVFWPGLTWPARSAIIAAAVSIPASTAIRINGALAATVRRFALSYLPDTCIRPFLLLGAIAAALALGVPLTASGVTWLLTSILIALALAQYLLLVRDSKRGTGAAPGPAPARLIRIWQREATPLIVVAVFTYFFADVDILLVTPLLTSAGTAVIGLCLKLAVLVGFAVQVAHQVVVPDLAVARARKDPGAIKEALVKALGFPLAITSAATAVVVLFGERLLAIFGPEFEGARLPLVLLIASQLARAAFGPSGVLLTVIGAQKENAALSVAALVVLAVANVVLAPLYGVLGAAIAVAVATVFWLLASAIVLDRLSGLRPDAVSLLAQLALGRSPAT